MFFNKIKPGLVYIGLENRVNHILGNSGLWMDLGGIIDNFFNFNFSSCVVAKKG